MKNKNKQTKFPVARIKKIMQKDEEVGKVAQATPVVISKALELFLGLIVEEASKVTIDRGSKKVEAYHLKHAVETTEMLDFLKEIVESVPDPSAGGTIDLESRNAEKKRRGKARKADGEPGTRKRRKKGDGDETTEKEDQDGEQEQEDVNMDEGTEDDGLPKRPRHQSKPNSHDDEEPTDWEDKPYIPKR